MTRRQRENALFALIMTCAVILVIALLAIPPLATDTEVRVDHPDRAGCEVVEKFDNRLSGEDSTEKSVVCTTTEKVK